MARAELRAHLRIPSQGLAIVTLPDGRKIEASVRDISLGGAFLLQSGDPIAVELGAVVEVYLFHPGRAADAVTVDADLLRAEPGGAGFVVRFRHEAPSRAPAALRAAVEWEAKQQGLRPSDLDLRPRRFATATWLMGWVARAAVIAMGFAGVQILFDWIDAIL